MFQLNSLSAVTLQQNALPILLPKYIFRRIVDPSYRLGISPVSMLKLVRLDGSATGMADSSFLV